MGLATGSQRGVCALVGVVTALLAFPVHAGGAFLYEIGTQEVGYASAGFAARANAPSTVFTNPAGMTRLDGIQVEVGLQALYAELQFQPGPGTSVSGNNGGNAVGFFPGASAFVTFAPWKDFRFGFGVLSNFGLVENWEAGWVGRYYATESALVGVSFLPSVAWNIVGGLSVGVSFNIMYGYLKYTTAVQNLEPGAADGALAMQSSTVGFGGNVGLLYEFSKNTRIGVTYTSPVKLNFSAVPSFTGLGTRMSNIIQAAGLDTASIDLGMTVPQTVMVSFFQTLGDRWAVMADFGWQNWAAFGTVEVQVTTDNPHSLTTDVGYLNTWHLALGGQVQLSDPWQLHFGMAYDSTMTNASNRSLALAIGDAWRFGVGAQWTVNQNWNLGFSYEFLWGGSPSVNVDRGPLAGTVNGSYANSWFQFFAFNFTWKS